MTVVEPGRRIVKFAATCLCGLREQDFPLLGELPATAHPDLTDHGEHALHKKGKGARDNRLNVHKRRNGKRTVVTIVTKEQAGKPQRACRRLHAAVKL